jgi:hypothetical protein
LAPLTQLQQLHLFSCCLTVVPEQVTALASLTRLELEENPEIVAGWQHLLPLTSCKPCAWPDVGSQLCRNSCQHWRLSKSWGCLQTMNCFTAGSTDHWVASLVDLPTCAVYGVGVRFCVSHHLQDSSLSLGFVIVISLVHQCL